MSSDVDCIVIGAGVVGLAVARAVARCGYDVVLTERNQDFGMETSARNSEVIHAGIYYPKDSLKAVHCVRGSQMLYDYCQAKNIPHRQIGKLIVACHENEIATLDTYFRSAGENGAADIRRLTKRELNALEPNVDAVAGLHSPRTGIVDSHAFMVSLLGDYERHDGSFVRKTEFVSARPTKGHIVCQFRDPVLSEISARVVINSGGLFASDVARKISKMPRSIIPNTEYAIGHYYAFSGKAPFDRLIYPVAKGGGLGIHATMGFVRCHTIRS